MYLFIMYRYLYIYIYIRSTCCLLTSIVSNKRIASLSCHYKAMFLKVGLRNGVCIYIRADHVTCAQVERVTIAFWVIFTSTLLFSVQGFFICHIINYTGYNQKWNVNQIRSAQWTVQKNKNKINIKVTQHKSIYIGKKREIKSKMCNRIKSAKQ